MTSEEALTTVTDVVAAGMTLRQSPQEIAQGVLETLLAGGKTAKVKDFDGTDKQRRSVTVTEDWGPAVVVA